MKINYRKVVIDSLADIEEKGVKEFISFVKSKPIPCWGAITKKFVELFDSPKNLKPVLLRWCETPYSNRFLLLMIHEYREKEDFTNLFIDKFEKLPILAQTYLLTLPEVVSQLKKLEKTPPPELDDLFTDEKARRRKRQMLLAKINKLLRFDWMPEEVHFEDDEINNQQEVSS